MPRSPQALSALCSAFLCLLLYAGLAQAGQVQAEPVTGLGQAVYLPLAIRQPDVSPTPAATIGNGNFEAGPGSGWAESSTVLGDKPGAIIKELHDTSIVAPRSGRYVAWLGGVHDDISILSQPITLPAGALRLEYAYRAYSEEPVCGADGGELALVRGETVNILGSVELCLATEREEWTVRQIDLAPYAGQTWTLRLRVTTNGSLYSHFFVDDISIVPN